MALLFENVGDGLTRNGSFLDLTQDLTVCLWAYLVIPETPTVSFYTLWNLGNNAPSYDAPGAWLGLDNTSSGGTGYLPYGYAQAAAGPAQTTDYAYLMPLGAWVHYALRYKAATAEWTVVISGREWETPLTLDMTGVGAQTLEYLATDTGSLTNLGVAYARTWQAWLTAGELRQEMRAAAAVRTADLLADTPLSNTLADISGNGNDWSLTDANATMRGPLTAAAGVPSGKLYASVSTSGGTFDGLDRIWQFNAQTGALIDPAYTISDGVVFNPFTGLAIDGQGRVYVAQKLPAP